MKFCIVGACILGHIIARPSFALDKTSNTIEQTSNPALNLLSARQIENQNYAKALKAARLGDKIGVEKALSQIIDPTLKPIVLRELLLSQKFPDKNILQNLLMEHSDLNGAQTLYEMAIHFGITATKPNEIKQILNNQILQLPREKVNKQAPNAQKSEGIALQKIADLFRANKDNEAASLALSQINGSYAGLAAWYGGLAAYRNGDFDTALILFSITSHWQYGDDYTKSEGSFWAARTAKKLKKLEYENYFLKRAASAPLSFYGQIALAKLNEWNDLKIPTIYDESKETRKLINNDKNVKNALWLFELGEKSLAESELEFAWRTNPNANDIAFGFIANALGFNELANKMAGRGNYSSISRQFPITEITPNGDAFVLDRALIFAIMRQESRFNQNAISYAGARGLMQLMPSTAAWLAKSPQLKANPELLHNNKLNVTLGEGYLEYVLSLNVIDNSVARALMAYNAGPGNVNKWKNRAENSEDTLMFIEATPNKQARDYVKKVMSNLWIYHKRLGQNAPTLEKLAMDKVPTYEPQDNPRQAGIKNSNIASIARAQ